MDAAELCGPGKRGFCRGDIRLEGTSEIIELQVLGNWAFIRNRIEMALIPEGGNRIDKSGYALTLLRKEPDGKWRLARDANLLTA